MNEGDTNLFGPLETEPADGITSYEYDNHLKIEEILTTLGRMSYDLDRINKKLDKSFDTIIYNTTLCNEKIKELEKIKKLCEFGLATIVALIITIIIVFASINI